MLFKISLLKEKRFKVINITYKRINMLNTIKYIVPYPIKKKLAKVPMRSVGMSL